jgi:hypothetical protein
MGVFRQPREQVTGNYGVNNYSGDFL